MKHLCLILILTISPLANSSTACDANRKDYFCIAPDNAPYSLVKEVDLYQVSAQIMQLYETEIASLPYPLRLDLRWNSPYFGAGVSLYNNQFNLLILGGTLRIDGFTKDALAALVCHELGHVIDDNWPSLEGAADYFAASECLPRYFESLGTTKDQIYSRVEEAGFIMLSSFKDVSTQTKDQPLVRRAVKLPAVHETITGYPSVQCRYETFRVPSKRSMCWYKE